MWVSLAVLAVVVIAVIAFRLGHMTATRSFSNALASDGELTKVVYNGRAYANPDDMPPDQRAAYESAIDTMVDRNHDGRIDVLESLNIPPVPLKRESAASNTPSEADFDRRERARQTFQQLKQLEKMKADGMITSAEYSSKRTELLREP
jgi:hypothetical protein